MIKPHTVHYAALVTVIFATYFITGKLGLMIFPMSGFTMLAWPPTGISLAVLLLFGQHLWPGIALGAFAVNLGAGASLQIALGIAVGSIAEVLCGVFLLKRYFGFHASFDRIKDALAFLATAFLGAGISASIGVATLWMGSNMREFAFAETWLAWWASEAVSIILYAPFLLIWGTSLRSIKMRPGRVGEVTLLTLSLSVVSWIAFSDTYEHLLVRYPLAYITFPFLIWAALRFGQRGAVTASLVVSIFVIRSVSRDLNLYTRETILANLYFIQIYLAATSATSIILASIVGERNRAAAMLQKSQTLLAASEQITHAGSWEWDLKSNQFFCSEEFCRIHKWDKPEQRAKTLEEFLRTIHPDDLDRIKTILTEKISKPGKFEFEERIILPSGQVRNLVARGIVFISQTGEAVQLIGTCQDITEQLEAKEVAELFKLEKMARSHAETETRLRNELVAMVSHDLRNPLTSVLTGIQLIQRSSWVDERGKRPLGLIERSAVQMYRMIQDLLDAHKIEERRFNIQDGRAAYDVLSIVQEALEAQQILANDKGLHLEMKIPKYLPKLFVNAERIQQVFQNLIGNAIKFTPRGGQIQLEAKYLGSNVIFSVRDSGPGIEESLLPHIFERFFQAKKTAQAGTGLGLSIVRGIVEAHGGTIWVESKVGVGSTFFFTLPVVESISLGKATA